MSVEENSKSIHEDDCSVNLGSDEGSSDIDRARMSIDSE